MRAAEWFAAPYREYGFGRGVHIRRIHYRIISQPAPVQLPGGGDYVNTVVCSKILGEAASAARFAGLVDAEDFEDRRNPEAIVRTAERVDEPVIRAIGRYIDDTFDIGPASFRVELPSFVIPDELLTPRLTISAPFQSPYHIEIRCEKSTINDVLVPLAEEYGLNLQPAVGEISITRCRQLVERAGNRPTRILYLSDFDPGGQSMPVAAARKIEWFARKHKDETGTVLDIQLHPVVLTRDQCIEYGLPRTPIRRRSFARQNSRPGLVRARPNWMRLRRCTKAGLSGFWLLKSSAFMIRTLRTNGTSSGMKRAKPLKKSTLRYSARMLRRRPLLSAAGPN